MANGFNLSLGERKISCTPCAYDTNRAILTTDWGHSKSTRNLYHDRIIVTNFDSSRVTSRSHFVINP
ncbi:hypothetical protein ANTRET_LOCUS1749 [Anthophora retusa]